VRYEPGIGRSFYVVHPKNLKETDFGAAVRCGSRTETARRSASLA
jgi:hypothetical protein